MIDVLEGSTYKPANFMGSGFLVDNSSEGRRSWSLFHTCWYEMQGGSRRGDISVNSHFLFLVRHHFFYPPAQLVRGFTISDFLKKPWLYRSSRPPRHLPLFISRKGFSIPTFQPCMLVDLHRISPTHALALSASRFVRNSPLL